MVCSWSGGKDSALALDLAVEAGARPLFAAPVPVVPRRRVLRDGCWVLDIGIAEPVT